jgi:hypothetical protein
MSTEPQVNIQMSPHSGVVAFDMKHNAYPVVGWYAVPRGKAGAAGIALYPLVLNCGRIESLTGEVLYSLVGNSTEAWLDLARYHNADGAGGPVPVVAPPAATGTVGFGGAESSPELPAVESAVESDVGLSDAKPGPAPPSPTPPHGRHSAGVAVAATDKLPALLSGAPNVARVDPMGSAVPAPTIAVERFGAPGPAGGPLGAPSQLGGLPRRVPRPVPRPVPRETPLGPGETQWFAPIVSASAAATDPRLPEHTRDPVPAPVVENALPPDPLVDPLPIASDVPEPVQEVIRQTRNGNGPDGTRSV